MKYFADVDSNGNVVNIITAKDSDTASTIEASHINNGTQWIEFKRDGSIRQRAAVVGGTYNSSADRFENPQPATSWTKDSTGEWQPPVAKPTDAQSTGMWGVQWNEDLQKWVSPKTSEVQALTEGQTASNYSFDNDTSTWVEITD